MVDMEPIDSESYFLPVIESLLALELRVRRSVDYPNKGLDLGIISSARAVLETEVDTDGREYRDIYSAYVESLLRDTIERK